MSTTLGTSLASTINVYEVEQKLGLVQSGRRGKGTHLSLSEFVNLLLGHGVEPRNALDRLIPEWRSAPATPTYGWMTRPPRAASQQLRGRCFEEVSIQLDVYRDSVFADLPEILVDGHWSGGMDPRCYQVLPGPTLGEALENFIDYLSRPDGQRLRIVLRNADWHLRLTSSGLAHVAYLEGGIEFFSQFTAPGHTLQTPAFFRSTTFGFAIFETLADLWADSRAQTEGKIPLSSPGSAPLPDGVPENEKPALPGAGPSGDRPIDAVPEHTPRKASWVPNHRDLSPCVCIPAIAESSSGRASQQSSPIGITHGRRHLAEPAHA